MFEFEMYGGSDKGLVRENNEDSIGYEEFDNKELALAIVADGVGGYEGGEIASDISVRFIIESIRKAVLLAKSGAGYPELWLQQVLLNALMDANQEILHQQSKNKQLERMSSTVVSAICRENYLAFSHYGDSRCYMWRNDQLIQLTKDHSVAQEMIDEGLLTEENYHLSPYHHVISHALGLEKEIKARASQCEIKHKDIFLLCSDGLTNCLDDQQITKVLKGFTDIQQCTDELISRANDAGGMDNISVVLVACKEVEDA